MMTDNVNHPNHYTAGDIEVWDYIAQITKLYPGDQAAAVCNIIKYISRGPLKGKKAEDIAKAGWYLDKLMKMAEKERENL